METTRTASDTVDRTGDPLPSESRRAFLKAGAAAPMILTSRKSAAQVVEPPPIVLPPSPPTRPWREELPQEIAPLEAVSTLDPMPQGTANAGFGECGRANHQRWQEYFGAPVLSPGQAVLYELKAREVSNHVFHPDYPAQPVWAYEGMTARGPQLGPTIFARYGRPVFCRLHNELPQDHLGFGTPEVSMHLHNLHTPSESDGFPGDYFSPLKSGPTLGEPSFGVPGGFKDQFYPNVYAGIDEFGGIGDRREALGTLWYHDHTLDFTAANAGRGLAGFYLLYDLLDSGNEHDRHPRALRLPSHPYDYPLLFQDKRFDAGGVHVFDQFDPEGTLGDKITVNGKIEPVLRVARRKYRLRLLNAGPSRFYQFYLVGPGGAVQPFSYIANDGNLLPRPLLNQKSVRLGVAERGDIVVDFSAYPLGTELTLVNRLQQTSTRGPGNVVAPGMRVLKLVVDREPPEPDVSQVPAVLRPLRPLDPAVLAAAPVRQWVFERTSGMWTVNGELVNVNNPRAVMTKGAGEIWELVNGGGGWDHPIHIHFEEGRILSKSVAGVPVPVPAHERGRKDVFVLEPDMTIRVFLRFRDFTGHYVMHCHNMIHEDHAMMVRWDIKA